MSEDELISKLMSLGFTKYEATVYYTLLKHGVLTSTELVRLSKIPQARLYDVIERLVSKGLVKVSRTRPTKYSVTDPKISLRSLVDKEYSMKSTIVDEFLRSLGEIKFTREESAETWIVKGWQGVQAVIRELIDKTRDELLIATYSRIIEKIVDNAKKLSELGASICLMIYDKYENLLDHLVYFDEVRFKPTLGPTILVFDSSKALLIPRHIEKRPIAYVIEDPEILSPVIGYFFHMREASELIMYKPINDQIERRYTNIERAIDAIFKAQESGVKVVVEAFGKWVKTGEEDVVRGKPLNYVKERYREIVTLIIETDKGEKISIGGKGSTFEDFEANRIIVRGTRGAL